MQRRIGSFGSFPSAACCEEAGLTNGFGKGVEFRIDLHLIRGDLGRLRVDFGDKGRHLRRKLVFDHSARSGARRNLSRGEARSSGLRGSGLRQGRLILS